MPAGGEEPRRAGAHGEPAVARATRSQRIDRVRGVAVAWVLIGHVLNSSPVPAMLGRIWRPLDPPEAVGLFFALSGYLVANGILAGPPGLREGLRTIVRRVIRLWGPHTVAMAFFALPPIAALVAWTVQPPVSSPREVLGVLAVSSAWWPGARTGRIVPGNWSISIEIAAAIVLLVPLTWLVRRWGAKTMLAILLPASVVVTLAGVARDQFWAAMHIPAFAAGIWLAGWLRSERAPWQPIALAIGSILGLAFVQLTDGAVFLGPMEVAWAPLLALLLSRPETDVPHGRSILAWFGRHSYGIYLFHFVGLTWVGATLRSSGLPWEQVSILTLIGVVITGVVGGFVTARFIERPSIRLGRAIAARI